MIFAVSINDLRFIYCLEFELNLELNTNSYFELPPLINKLSQVIRKIKLNRSTFTDHPSMFRPEIGRVRRVGFMLVG